MKKILNLSRPLLLLFCLLNVYFYNIHAQTKDKMINFIAAFKFKNWIGYNAEKADGANWNPKTNTRFTFYVNGDVTSATQGDDGNWTTTTGKWQLYQSGNTWMIKVSGKAYRLQPHFADTNENEKLDMLDDDDLQHGRLVNVYTLKANGYQ